MDVEQNVGDSTAEKHPTGKKKLNHGTGCGERAHIHTHRPTCMSQPNTPTNCRLQYFLQRESFSLVFSVLLNIFSKKKKKNNFAHSYSWDGIFRGFFQLLSANIFLPRMIAIKDEQKKNTHIVDIGEEHTPESADGFLKNYKEKMRKS